MSLAAGRLEDIRRIVDQRHAASVEELSDAMRVSPATVRRDLLALDRLGQLRRVHGGAVRLHGTTEEPLFEDKASIAEVQKLAIAERAAACVERNDCLYLDGGSTVLAMAALLAEDSSLTVVTNSLRVAMRLSSGNGPRTIVIGGELRRLSQTFVGPLTQPLLERLHFDKAFMGTIGLTLNEGMTTTDPDEAFTKQLVVQRAQRVFLLADSAKLDKVSFARAGTLNDVDCLITDDAITATFATQLRRRRIECITVSCGSARLERLTGAQ